MKNIRNFILMLLASLCLGACNKVEVGVPTLDVEVDSLTFKKGDLVNFKFTGDADQITFYSGEPLNDYAFKDGRIVATNSVNASFSSHVQYGTHPDLLSVWVSTDFSGIYSYEEVAKATWKNNVTKNFVYPPNTQSSGASGDAKPSGILDLMSEFEEDKPLYIAFKYKKRPDSAPGAGTQRTWYIRNIATSLVSDFGEQNLFNGSAFTLVYDYTFPDIFTDPSLFKTTIHRSSVNATSGLITIRGNSGTIEGVDYATAEYEIWAISPAINLVETDLGPDKGIPIKGFRDLKKEGYSYTYTKPGVYKATFIASNSNIYGKSEVIKEVLITVTN